MGKAEEYETNAANSLRLAHVVRDAGHRAVLIEMARTWQTLAQQARALAEEEKI